jgi:Ca2+-transporting ATPase
MTVIILDVAGHRVDLVEELRRESKRLTSSPCLEPDEEVVKAVREHPVLPILLAGGALSNDALLECEGEDFNIIGDPTEGALLVSAARIGLEKETLEKVFPRVAEVPFDSERKRMTTVHQVNDWVVPGYGELPKAPISISSRDGRTPYLAFTKGAVDSLLHVSDRVLVGDQVEQLDQSWRDRIMSANNEQAKSGVRVLGVAAKPWEEVPQEVKEETVENGLVFIGLVGMIDPARPEVKDAVQTCKTAGIRPVMITGDHPLTARYIAEELGISTNGRILTGEELEEISAEEFEQVVDEVNVYARVSPQHKLNIVDALQKHGQIVAMTGDGVNDAPALNTADIGVAMGITGTDVAKEASDIVLLDDNFATIVAAVEEGRRIYDNIRKFIKYTMTSNAGEIWVMLLAPFIGMPFPLLPLQILWINLVTDGLPGLALAIEPAERKIMQRSPFDPKESIFGRGMARDILWVGALMGLVSLVVGFWYWSIDHPYWQTMVFTTLTLSQMGNALAIRSQRESLFQIGLLSNRAMLGAVLLTFALQMVVIYLPFFQSIFETGPLALGDLLISLLLSTAVFWGVEIQKWLIRRSERK